jgi:hypothetical protein
VIYALTPYGESALPMLELVRLWGNHHLERTRAQKPDTAHQPPSCARPRGSTHTVASHRERTRSPA